MKCTCFAVCFLLFAFMRLRMRGRHAKIRAVSWENAVDCALSDDSIFFLKSFGFAWGCLSKTESLLLIKTKRNALKVNICLQKIVKGIGYDKERAEKSPRFCRGRYSR